MADPRYGRLLSAADLRLLLNASGRPVTEEPGLRMDPVAIEGLLRSPAVYDSLFGGPDRDPVVFASPFLAFAVLVHRVAAELDEAAFIEEWLGPGRSLPLFDVGSLREFLSDGSHRAFLAELLASYTRVTSGSVWHRTARGWRRWRYSELDPVRLAQLLEVVPDEQRPAVCRRLGDLALFLSGVFPEHVAAHPLEARHVERIRRLLDATRLDPTAPVPDELVTASGPQRGVWLLEWLGRRAYRIALRGAPAAAGDLEGLVEGFSRARRVLNVLTRRHLYPIRERWFPAAG